MKRCRHLARSLLLSACFLAGCIVLSSRCAANQIFSSDAASEMDGSIGGVDNPLSSYAIDYALFLSDQSIEQHLISGVFDRPWNNDSLAETGLGESANCFLCSRMFGLTNVGSPRWSTSAVVSQTDNSVNSGGLASPMVKSVLEPNPTSGEHFVFRVFDPLLNSSEPVASEIIAYENPLISDKEGAGLQVLSADHTDNISQNDKASSRKPGRESLIDFNRDLVATGPISDVTVSYMTDANPQQSRMDRPVLAGVSHSPNGLIEKVFDLIDTTGRFLLSGGGWFYGAIFCVVYVGLISFISLIRVLSSR